MDEYKSYYIHVDDLSHFVLEATSDYSDELVVLKKGSHKLKFSFTLPSTELPSSFESKLGTIRYFLHVCVDIPYASPPQTMKHFTVIGQKNKVPPQEWLVSKTSLSRNRCHEMRNMEMNITKTSFC